MKKPVFKSILKAFLSLLLILSITGCQNKEEKTTIKFSSWGSESEIAILKPLLKQFESENPDIKVEFIHIPKNYFQKLHLLVASNLTPDVIFLNNLNGRIYAENSILLDLSKYLKNDRLISEKDFFNESLQALSYKNKLYAVPRDISNLVIYYNKDLFIKNGVPIPDENWTLNDFLEVSKKLTKDFNKDGRIDQFGVGFEDKPIFWLPFLWSNSGGILDRNLNIIIDKPESVESVQFYSDLRNKWHVAPSKAEIGSATVSQLFMQRKVAMQISGRWSVPRYRKDLDFNWDITKFPKGKAGSIVDADASGWAISKNTNNPDESWKLIRFFASKRSSSQFTKDGLIVPARVDTANSDVFLNPNLKPQNSKVFIDIIPDSIPTPVTSNYQEILDIINASLEPVFEGNKDAKEVLNKNFARTLNDIK